MTRKELNALKVHLLSQKEKAVDMETLAEKLFGLLGELPVFLPEEVKKIIDKYKKG